MAQYSVLLVDDDEKIIKLLESYFIKDNFLVFKAYDGLNALEVNSAKKPDIIVLDLMLPGLSGLEVCKQIRKESETPILMLTARDEETDRLIGLEIGADDYVAKPFSPREVVARVKVILRRTNKTLDYSNFIKIGDLIIDVAKHSARLKDNVLELTPTEFKILELLAIQPGRVFSRLQIVEQVQGYAFEGYERTIDAHIKNLRKKIEANPKEPQLLQTVYGVGYKFVGDKHV